MLYSLQHSFPLFLTIHTIPTNDKVRSRCLNPEVTSRHLDPERILQPAEPHDVSTHIELATKRKAEATCTIPWETIRHADNSNNANRDRKGVEEPQTEPGTAAEDGDGLIVTSLREGIADEFKSQVGNRLATIPDMAGEAVGQLCATTLSAQSVFRAVRYATVGNVILDQIRTFVIAETFNKHCDQYSGASKAAEALCKRLLCKGELFVSIA